MDREPQEAAETGQELEHVAAPAHGSTALIVAANAHEKVTIATEIATTLDSVIKQQGLRTKIGRRKAVSADGSEQWVDAFHVNVEGWQTLATFLDLAVVPLEPEPVIDPATGAPRLTEYEVVREIFAKGTRKQAIKDGTAVVEAIERATIKGFDWRCRTEVFKDGVKIAAATAIVSRGEESWRDRPENALQSMAQTRSTGKAIAGAARWIVTLAGYSGTPAEEMPREQQAAESAPSGSEHPHGEPASEDLARRFIGALHYLVGQEEGDRTATAIYADCGGYLPQKVARAVGLAGAAEKARREGLIKLAARPTEPEEAAQEASDEPAEADAEVVDAEPVLTDSEYKADESIPF